MQEDVKTSIDLEEIVRLQNIPGRKLIMRVGSDRIWIRTLPSGEHCGHHSKEIKLKRFVALDDLFFEGLGLWCGEGGRNKGIYFGNSNASLLQRFLDFVEQKIGLARSEFKAAINVPIMPNPRDASEREWSNKLGIPMQNFTRICVDPRINKEYTQVYFNSVILAELMKNLHLKSTEVILKSHKFCTPFLRGLFSAKGSIILKKSGVLHHITFSSKDDALIQLLKQCLRLVGVEPSSYSVKGMNLQIYGLPNFRRFRELGVHTLHPEKFEKFERGFASYMRTNVLDGEEARKLILQQLASGPKTYDDLAVALGKARTTIQAHHIPILEKRGLIKRAGKRGQAWMWELAKPVPVMFPNPVDRTFVAA